MARLADVPKVIRSVGFAAFSKRVWAEVGDDNLFTWAAALAYSWMFAIFPFLIFLLTLLPYLPDRAKAGAKREVHDFVYRVLPSQDAADSVWKNVDENFDNLLHRTPGKLLSRLFGIGLALWAASGGMAMTMDALDKCYEVEKGRAYYRQRPLAMGLTLVVALLLVLVVALLPVGTLVRNWVVYQDPGLKHSPLLFVFDLARWALSLFFMVVVLALLYYKGPAIRHRFNWLSPGAAFCVVVWVVLGLAFRFYVHHWGRYNQTYGTVGGVAVLLLFFYVDALVLLVGCEIDSEIDFEVLKVRRGTRDFRHAEDLGTAPPTAM